jgi:hypothetical protein
MSGLFFVGLMNVHQPIATAAYDDNGRNSPQQNNRHGSLLYALRLIVVVNDDLLVGSHAALFLNDSGMLARFFAYDPGVVVFTIIVIVARNPP